MTHLAYIRPLYEETPNVPDWERLDLDTPPSRRRHRRLPITEAGELEEDEISPGVRETHWAPIAPRWTKEPPVREGLYFVRLVRTVTPLVVDVYRADNGRLFMRWSDIPDQLVAPNADLEFSDRAITVPVETKR